MKNSYTIEINPAVSIPDFLTSEIQSKLAYADTAITNVRVSNNKISLSIDCSPDTNADGITTARRAEIESKVQTVVLSMAKNAIKPKIVVLEDHMDRPVPYKADPMIDLIESSEISREAKGVYTLGPLLSRLVDYFEDISLSLAKHFNASPYRFPVLISPHYLERVNYFSAFPHSLSFVTHLQEDLTVIDNFAQSAACDDHGLNAPPGSFSPVQVLLSPAVCYHLYFALADKPLPHGRLAATAVGNCFRYEAINLESLERLWNFTMREIIFVGPKDYVLENREIARKYIAQIFEQIGFAYRVESATDPFFIGEFRKQAAFQSAFQLKYEIRARLPFKDSTLAIGSYNYHQDFFGRNLNITLPDGSPAHTSCVAFGLEREAYAFLSQFGIDPLGWPKIVKDGLS